MDLEKKSIFFCEGEISVMIIDIRTLRYGPQPILNVKGFVASDNIPS